MSEIIKRVAITGAGGTLGQVVARHFDRAGWSVWPSALNAREMGSLYVKGVDVTSEREVKLWFEDMGQVDVLVTCAGISHVEYSESLDFSDFCHVIDVNLNGSFLCAQQAYLVGAKRIIFIGSIHGCTRTGYPQRAPYNASKGGILALTETLAIEWGPFGTAVNCVSPGHLPVLMPGTQAGSELLNAARERTPTGELATPEECTDVIYFLAAHAPLSLTGQNIAVSGGFEINTFPITGG